MTSKPKSHYCFQCGEGYPADYMYITEDNKVVCKECMDKKKAKAFVVGSFETRGMER